jgi:hypothetical protein
MDKTDTYMVLYIPGLREDHNDATVNPKLMIGQT